MASAFPTLSPTASTVRKSFFDAASIGAITGNALVAIYPLNERKGKVRNYFVTVHVTLFEVHKSLKDSKNKKPAKYLVDLGDVFNVSIQNEPIQIKDNCICIMDPNSSFFVKPIDSDYDLQAWFDWILERSRECRSTKLLRPVFREEYFEAAWDVQIVRKPKLRRDYSKKQIESQSEDLTEKRPQMLGHRRLCICPNSFLLFIIGCRPNSNVDMPFDKSTFIDLPLNVISSYGTQERYFFMRIGRCSEIGSGDIWMATEHGASARAMHERISQINQRESERRRAQGIKINIPTISSSVLKSRAHRERSQTQNQMHKIDSQSKLKGAIGFQPGNDLRKISTASKLDANQQHGDMKTEGQMDERSSFGAGRTELTTCLQSIPERCIINESNFRQSPNIIETHSSKKNSIVGLFALRIGAKMSTGSFGKPADPRLDQLTAPYSPTNKNLLVDKKTEAEITKVGSNPSLVNLSTSSNHSGRNSLVNTVFGIRLTRRGSIVGTSSNQQSTQSPDQKPKQSTASCSSFNAQSNYDCAEDYMTYDADEHNKFGNPMAKLSGVNNKISTNLINMSESRKNSTAACPPGPVRQFSTNSGGLPERNIPGKSNQLPILAGDYLEMDHAQRQANIEQPMFALHQVQSYISNSSESCWTPGSSNTVRSEIAPDVPRAYSLGSKPRCTVVDDLKITSTPSTSDPEPPLYTSCVQSKLLHPCTNGSPPNYLKKNVISQTLKNKTNERVRTKTENTITTLANLQNGALDLDKDKQPTETMRAIIRKRAHSETWIKQPLRKFTTANGLKKNQKEVRQAEINSIDSNNSRRNTCGAKSMDSGSSCYPRSMDDHIEIDFDIDESPSMDSIPSLQSRHSSVGVQCPLSVRSALDSLTHPRTFGCTATAEKPSEILIRTKTRNEIKQMERKRSVPEMFKNVQTTHKKIELSNYVDQNRLHPNRRSTCDTSALRQKFAEKDSTNLPQFADIHKENLSCQSACNETSFPESLTGTTIESGNSHGSIAIDDNDYVILGNHVVHGQNNTNELNVHSIGTIRESSSPCSSMSSDGEWKRRSNKLENCRKMSPITVKNEFQDDYSLLMIKPKKTGQNLGEIPPDIIEEKMNRIRLNTSTSSQSSSPRHSPHSARRKFSAQTQHPSPVCSYFPVQHQPSSQTSSPSFSASRKITIINSVNFDEKKARRQIGENTEKRVGENGTNIPNDKCEYTYIAE